MELGEASVEQEQMSLEEALKIIPFSVTDLVKEEITIARIA